MADSGYILQEVKEDMLRFDENGEMYVEKDPSFQGYHFYEQDDGFFARHIIRHLGFGTVETGFPAVFWVLSGDAMLELIRSYNEELMKEEGYEKEPPWYRHLMFLKAPDRIQGGLSQIIWEDFS